MSETTVPGTRTAQTELEVVERTEDKKQTNRKQVLYNTKKIFNGRPHHQSPNNMFVSEEKRWTDKRLVCYMWPGNVEFVGDPWD